MTQQTVPPCWMQIYGSLRWRLMKQRFRFEPPRSAMGRQLLVDVSTIIHADSRTGIQRVVRALLGQLMACRIPGVVVQPVFSGPNHAFCHATLLPDGRLANASRDPKILHPVQVRKGDVFLALDLAAQTLPFAERQLAQWRRAGVSINIVVYDLLPVICPHWFSPRLVRNFRRWLALAAKHGDRYLCISDTVKHDLLGQLRLSEPPDRNAVAVIPLGADLEASFPSLGLPEDHAAILDWARRGRTILAVGTIEPRKAHDCLLAAMEHIWSADPATDVALLVVGRPGWKTGSLQDRIRSHPEFGRRLIWLSDVSDALLLELYQSCSGLVSASRQEGFGLPLVEAAAHGMPVLARDIPVFREVGGDLFDYFDDDLPAPFAKRITQWLAAPRRPSQAQIDRLPQWRESAAALLSHLGLPALVGGQSQ